MYLAAISARCLSNTVLGVVLGGVLCGVLCDCSDMPAVEIGAVVVVMVVEPPPGGGKQDAAAFAMVTAMSAGTVTAMSAGTAVDDGAADAGWLDVTVDDSCIDVIIGEDFGKSDPISGPLEDGPTTLLTLTPVVVWFTFVLVHVRLLWPSNRNICKCAQCTPQK